VVTNRHSSEVFLDIFSDTYINAEDASSLNVTYEELEDTKIVPGTGMTVAQFEAKLEVMYGISDIDVKIEDSIDGWATSNWTLGVAYIFSMTFGFATFWMMIVIIYMNELKYRKIYNVWYLFNRNYT